MSGYYHINLHIVMRDCRSATDAVTQMIRLMPNKPDETTAFMESWSVGSVSTPEGTHFDRSCRDAEESLERLVSTAERNA